MCRVKQFFLAVLSRKQAGCPRFYCISGSYGIELFAGFCLYKYFFRFNAQSVCDVLDDILPLWKEFRFFKLYNAVKVYQVPAVFADFFPDGF